MFSLDEGRVRQIVWATSVAAIIALATLTLFILMKLSIKITQYIFEIKFSTPKKD